MRLPLIGGSYVARSIIANAQRCINYYPERNTKDSLVPVTHYQRPGLVPLVTGPSAPVRGLYRATNDLGYTVIGNSVYVIGANWGLALLGQLNDVGRTTPVSMVDNGNYLLIVDGSQYGYTVKLADGTFSQLIDPTGTFEGADRIDYIDTFLVWNLPGTNQFGSSLSNVVQFDPTYIAAKTAFPDRLKAAVVNRNLLLLIGSLKTEVWNDAGLSQFPFAKLPGAYYEHGTIAVYSIACQDISTYFLGQDNQGQGVVFRIRGFECQRISNHAMEYTIRQLAASAKITDAIGYTHQLDGHVFYVLHFPSANQTWQFDEASQEWSQLCWMDPQNGLGRHRGNCAAFINGVNVCGDYANGTIYQMDPNTYTDTVAGVTCPLVCIRGFPHMGAGTSNLGAPGLDREVPSDGKRVQYKQFLLDLECGMGAVGADGNPAQVTLRWSTDRGRTFGNGLLQSTGAPGQYLTEPQWRQLGIARDMVFEIEHSVNGPAALNGAWVQAEVLGS